MSAATVYPVDSIDDPRLAVYRNLKDRELAREGDRFIAEGENVVRRMIEGDFPVESVLTAERKLAGILPAVPAHVPVFVTSDQVMTQILGFKFHSGVIGCGRRKASPTLEQVLPPLDQPATVVVLPELNNSQNLGALMRICAGLGADALILGERSCDPFWRISIRVSMGAVFKLPIVRSDDILRDLHRLRTEFGVQLAASVLDDAAEPLPATTRPPRFGLLFGTEGPGLAQEHIDACDRKITMPMKMGTDSLNVSIAAAVFLYHFRVEARMTKSESPNQCPNGE